MHKKGFYERRLKRPIDFIMALVGIIILSPIILVVGFLVRVNLGSPVIFKQERPGLNGKIFTMYKFRSMTNSRDENGKLLSDEERLTKFGKFLRSTSLDELPELVNILEGTLSVCGPRPLLKEYLPLYNEYQFRRHEVRPGLTGYAQVNGRNSIKWEEKFELDVKYVDNISFIGDFKIILKTIAVILKRDGINSDNSVTMEDFTGTK